MKLNYQCSPVKGRNSFSLGYLFND